MCTTADLSFRPARALVTSGDGTLYFTQGSRVGRVLPCAAPEANWIDVGVTALNSVMVDPPNRALYVGAANANTIYKIDLAASTPAATVYATVPGPDAMTLGPDGALWVAARDSVVRIAAGGEVSTVTTSTVSNPKAVAFRPDGSLLVAEYGGGILTLTLAGGVETGRTTFASDPDGTAFVGLSGLAIALDGTVYVSNDDGGPLITVLDVDGAIIETLPDGLGGPLDFGGGPLTSSDLYVAGVTTRIPRPTAGLAVPWHAP